MTTKKEAIEPFTETNERLVINILWVSSNLPVKKSQDLFYRVIGENLRTPFGTGPFGKHCKK